MRVGIGAGVVLLIVALGVAVLISAFATAGSSRTVPADPAVGTATDAPAAARKSDAPGIFVHILGAVAKPGLYQLHDGDRAVDAVAAAGGFAAKADTQRVNLARFLSDGEQLYVPTIGETAAPTRPGAMAGPAGKVNLNTADQTALETLPRVGPAMAARIIAWREANGRFASIEDLMSVSGIGQKTFEQLKALVTV